MSLNPDIRDQAYQFFIEEAQELLQVLETGLLDLREDRSTPKVHELMRAAHSIKGGAASVELSAIELLAHRLEDFFKALYSDSVDFDNELESLLLQGYDCLATPLLEQIESGSYNEEAALLAAEPVFHSLEIRLEDALKNADSYIPSSSDLGVDIVSSIFEVDVVQGIEHLQQVVANPNNFDASQEFQQTLDMFAGFAELFNLSGFSDIVQTAQTALNQNRDRVGEIIQATIADLTISKDLVLAGDRELGGEVSPTLIALAQSTNSTSLVDDPVDVFGETPLNNSNDIWSTAPATNDELTDDVFGEIPSMVGEDGVEGVDDIFGTIPAPDVAVGSTTDVDDVFGEIPTMVGEDGVEGVDDIFGTIPAPDVAVGSTTDGDDVFGEILPMAGEDGVEGVDDIFGTIPVSDVAVGSTTDADDVFGEILPMAGEDGVEGVDDIFGTIPAPDPVDLPEGDLAVGSTANDIKDIFDDRHIPKSKPETKEKTATSNENKYLDRLPNEISDRAISQEASDDAERIFDSVVDPNSSTENLDLAEASETIEDAVKSIENVFDSLPAIEAEAEADALALAAEKALQKESPPASTDNKPPSKSRPSKSSKAPAKLSVRVDLDRLERMNNSIGELTINRNSLSLQNEQLQESVTELGQKFFRFREITQKLREISDKIILEERVKTYNNELSPSSLDDSDEFDALEMDNYSDVYSSIQNILEEIVQLEESVDDITIFAKQCDSSINSQRQMLGQMRDELMWVRMLPLDKILQRFPRTIRELSNKYKKPVDLKLIGTDVLVDKAVLEKLSDPLLHLLRNGFDHGIESPQDRLAGGKSPNGTIQLHAYHQGNQTVIEIKDDGKGLDLEKIAQKGIEKGLISAGEVAVASKERIYDLIFEPGFSTASKVSELSGRGVGMNIVRSQIETLKGKITVTSSPGKGSIFTLRLPLTLTIAKLLVCSLGDTAFAIPSDSIEEIIIPTEEQIRISNKQRFLFLNGKLVPIYPLKEILQYNCPITNVDRSSKAFKTIESPQDWFAPLLILKRGQQLFALEVVNLVSEQELVIKPYSKAIAAPQYSYGCTILGDGSLIPAFDGGALIGTILGEEVTPVASGAGVIADLDRMDTTLAETSIATDEPESFASEAMASTANSLQSVPTIMIVDDSTALRRTMALTLEKQGYRVIQKKDGRDALDGYRQNPDIDLIICDIEMPTMNGFEFLGMRRRDSKLSQVPTFMLTSRSGVKHRNLAKQLGANGYFTKPFVEQEFVTEIRKVLGNNQAKNKQPNFNTPRQQTILLIDDSSALRRTLSLCLENKGYSVLQGRDGVEGLELLRNNPETDLIICDIEMPNMNGFEFLTSRRQDPQLFKTPTIMLTSRSTEKHRSLANSLGANGYFTKPYVQEKFLQDVDSFINRYSASKL